MSELAQYFLYLGVTGFGGPLVLIQQMRIQFCDKLKTISHSEFDQAFALVKAMPGPVAFQMAVFLGRKFHGFWGGFTAGFCLLLPSFLMMLVFGLFYQDFVQFKFVQPILNGLLYSASAVILLSLKNLVWSNKSELLFWVFLIFSAILAWHQLVPEPVLIVGCGLLALISDKLANKLYLFSPAFFFVDWPQVYRVFKICLYAGAFVFGTGFALIPVLKTSLVDINQMINIQQFNDGVVFGQMTPGPITITATFLGYEISGVMGALAATIGVFLMPFIHIISWFPLAIGWLTKQKWISRFLSGATAAVVGSILATLEKMNETSFRFPMFWALFGLTLIVMIKKPKIPIVLVFLAAGILNLGFTALSSI